MRKISTQELIALLKSERSSYLEVSLNNKYFKATHFMTFGGKKIYDTGIDSKDIKWKCNEFLEFYPYAYWKIDQIIR